MKIDISDLLKSVGAELKIDKSEDLKFNKDELNLSSPVSLKLSLVNTGKTVLVSGTLKTKVRLECSRCLKEFEYPVSIKIEEEYVSKASTGRNKREEPEELELKDDDFVFEIDEKNIIDLDEAIRQNIIVSLPIKQLCSKSCSVDKLVKSKEKSVDPRLEKLKSIKITGGN